MKKIGIKIVLAVFVVSLIFPLFAGRTESANLTTMSDTMSRLKISQNSNHTIVFTTPTGVGAGEKIKVTFSSGFASGLNGVDFADMDLADDGSDLALDATPSGATWGAAVSTRTVTFTSGTGTIVASSVITIEIGTNATYGVPGDTQIANPGSSGSNTINLAITTAADADIDTGSLAVAIMDEDQITVSATVNPTITSELLDSGNNPVSTCGLGTLTTASVSGCIYKNRVNTNATSGYSATIVENGNLCNPSVAVCTYNITDVADGAVSTADSTDEYGVSTSDANATGITADYDGTCGTGATEDASAITGSAQIYADESSPQTNDDTTLCHSAVILGATASGIYSHIVTHITTGNF